MSRLLWNSACGALHLAIWVLDPRRSNKVSTSAHQGSRWWCLLFHLISDILSIETQQMPRAVFIASRPMVLHEKICIFRSGGWSTAEHRWDRYFTRIYSTYSALGCTTDTMNLCGPADNPAWSPQYATLPLVLRRVCIWWCSVKQVDDPVSLGLCLCGIWRYRCPTWKRMKIAKQQGQHLCSYSIIDAYFSTSCSPLHSSGQISIGFLNLICRLWVFSWWLNHRCTLWSAFFFMCAAPHHIMYRNLGGWYLLPICNLQH